MEPTTAELARDLKQLEARVERERAELIDEVRRGFADLRRAIDDQANQRITRDVYRADQRRQELEMKNLHREVSQTRWIVIGSFLAVISVGIAMMMLGI